MLSRHNFILLGLRGQAKSRILRALVSLLDEHLPVVAGCEIHDDPLEPICSACRMRVAAEGDDTNIAWLPREARYVEKLATPDVTIADMLGDIDPIKAARSGLQLSDELTIHYGLLPRANRGIFGINELPDLAGKIQVGLFNILQEGDIQIKGYPVRLPLDLLMVFTANPEDYTARGKIITPLKDRIGSEIRTHYPATPPARDGDHRAGSVARSRQGRQADRRAGLRARGRRGNRVSGARRSQDRSPLGRQPAPGDHLPRERAVERRAPRADQRRAQIVARVTDVYAALPSITGKFEMEYEGELKGADNVARELIRASVANVFAERFEAGRHAPRHRVVRSRRLAADGRHRVGEGAARAGARRAGARRAGRPSPARTEGIEPALASAVDFVLEGLYAQKKISRSDERGYHAAEQPQRRPTARAAERDVDEGLPLPGGKKKYYN